MTDKGGGGRPLPVRLRNLSLQAFRNYRSLYLEPDAGLTLIVGPNGQGKTNLIEAIYFLCLGRSFRERSDRRLIMFGEERTQLEGVFDRDGGAHSIRMVISREGGKRAQVDGNDLERIRDLVGQAPVVGFTPEDSDIVKGDPASRRRFLDLILAQTDREYLEALQLYRRALAQRNICLREGRIELIESWEEALVVSGAMIRKSRTRLIMFFAEVACDTYTGIGPRGEAFTIRYRPNPPLGEGGADELVVALSTGRQDDLDRGFTGAGPHRDDIVFEIGGRNLRMYGSHGQARTALASLKLAEVAYYTFARDRQPILVMDEIASVLDKDRTENLVQLLAQEASQVFITAPSEEDLGVFASKAGCVVCINEGRAEIRQ
ncbi:DNA replication/repair protein RecF [Gemmatimonadota bacterium]